MTRRFPCAVLPKDGQVVVLDKDTSHHLLRVTVVPRGSRVLLFDGQGGECDAELQDSADGLAQLRGLGAPRRQAEPAPCILIAGLTRRAAWESTVRMAVELGVTELRGFPGRRSVAAGGRPDRWSKIADAAARQSGRYRMPIISPPAPLSTQLTLPEGLTRLVLLPGEPVLQRPASGGVALLIGPEGGLAPQEVELALTVGFQPAGLGPHTLRADTAAAAALSAYRPITP